MRGVNAELVTEFAKDKVYEDCNAAFKDQAYIFGQQHFRLSRLIGKVEVIVTDCPLLLSIIYNPNHELFTSNFDAAVMDIFNFYDNMNYYLVPDFLYSPDGRIHTESESEEISEKILMLLNEKEIPFTVDFSNNIVYEHIADDVVERINQNK